MKLRCMINGVEYDIIQGATFSEEYNETLDSGTIILDHVNKIEDLKPYDDVYIYSNPGSFKGYPVQQRIVGDNLQDKYILTTLPSLISADGDMRFILGKSFYNFMNDKDDIVGNVNLKFNFNMQSVSAENLRIDSEDIDNDNQDEDVVRGKIQNPNDFGVYVVFQIGLFDGGNPTPIETINFNKEIAAFGSFNLEDEVDTSSYTGNFNRIEVSSTTYPKNGNNNDEYDSNKYVLWDKQYISLVSNVNVDSIKKQYNCTVSIQLSPNGFIINKNGTGGDSNNLYIYLCEKTFNNNNRFVINYSNYELNGNVYADFPYSFDLIDSKLNVNISYTYENLSDINEPYFYKHLLVDQFTEEMLNIDKDYVDQYFKYTIQLFSETKKLETIQLPNISITQPLNYSKKRSIYDYLVSFVDMYSPLIKVETGETWTYEKKYTISPSLEATFGNTFSPDFVMNTPNLRDLLSKLMIVKDRIPYVKDDVIYSMDITARNGEFNDQNVNFITGSMSSDTYCDNLKRNYTEALSQDNNARLVEYLGFRNSNASLMTLENMRLETRFPIYKINKMYMCYYKKIDVILDDDTSNKKEMAFLCKQDMTPFVKLNSERNLLSENWEDLNGVPLSDIENLSKFKLTTVGYDIGSKNITGWGEKYSYPLITSVWDVTKSYVENIHKILDRNIFGIDSFSQILDSIRQYYPNAQTIQISSYGAGDYAGIQNIVSSFGASTYPDFLRQFVPDALPLKSLFFQIDYNAFYSGAVIQSKDDSRDDIVIGDNQSSSLTLLEQDGIAQKEKANRFANETLRINARYDGDYKNLQPLGSVYNNKTYEDVVIYHREYSIWDNMISAVYYGSKDYVLKNYFTSVFARYRTYNLMSYGESTNRAENKRMLLCFSKDNCNYESENKQFALTNFDNFYSKVLSGLKPIISPYYTGDKINYGYIKFNTVLDLNGSKDSEQTLDGSGSLTIPFDFSLTRQLGTNSIFSNFEISNVSYNIVHQGANGGGSIDEDSLNSFTMSSNGHITGNLKFDYSGFEGSLFDFVLSFNYREIETSYYGSDINIFNSGLALCFNIKMFDNVSSGLYIDNPNPIFGITNSNFLEWISKILNIKTDVIETVLQSLNPVNVEEQIMGSSQKWLLTVDDIETGFANEIGFYICHIDSDDYFANNKVVPKTDVFNDDVTEGYTEGYYSKILKLPQIEIEQIDKNNILGNDYTILKDNKECIDMTFEIEAYSKDKNVVISPLLLQLSDLLGNCKRFSSNNEYSYLDAKYENEQFVYEGTTDITVYATTIGQMSRCFNGGTEYMGFTMPLMIIEIPENIIQNLSDSLPIDIKYKFAYDNFNLNGCCEKSYYGNKTPYVSNDAGCQGFSCTISRVFNDRYDPFRSIVQYSFETSFINKIENINGVYYFDIEGIESIKISNGGLFQALSKTFVQSKTMRFKAVNNLESFNITGTYPENGNIWLVNLEKATESVPIQTDPIVIYGNIERIRPIVDNEVKYIDGRNNFTTDFAKYRFTNGNSDNVDAIFFKGNNTNDNRYYGNQYDSWLQTYNTIPLKDKGKTSILYDSSTITFPQNMFIVYSDKVIDKTNMYDQFPNLSSVDGYISTETQHSFEEIFSINDLDVPYISVNLSYLPSGTNSVQYWYYDTSELDNNGNPMSPLSHSNSYRFVFGVNVTDADRNAGEIRVYLSLTSTKDERIYDIMHKIIGKNHNYYFGKADERYGIRQNFDYIDQYFVKFEPNCPESEYSGTMESETMNIGVPQTLTDCAYSRNNYTFVGWSRKPSPNVVPQNVTDYSDYIDFEDEEQVAFNENTVLYAIWQELPYTPPTPVAPTGGITYTVVGNKYSFTVEVVNSNNFACKAYYSVDGISSGMPTTIVSKTLLGTISANSTYGPMIQLPITSSATPFLYTLYLENAEDSTKTSYATFYF